MKTVMTHRSNSFVAMLTAETFLSKGEALLHASVMVIVIVLFTTVLNTAVAAGATQRVEARPGEIVILRDVPKRPAARPGSPGKALLLDAGQAKRFVSEPRMNGLVEIGDVDAAAINTGAASPLSVPEFSIPPTSLNSQNPTVNSSLRGGFAGGGTVMRSIGNIHRVTEGLDKQINAVVRPLRTHGVAQQ